MSEVPLEGVWVYQLPEEEWGLVPRKDSSFLESEEGFTGPYHHRSLGIGLL